MAKEAVTLFIDDTNIRLLVARGKRLQKWARLPLEPGLVRDAVIVDEAQVASKIRELFVLEKVRARKVIVGLSGLNSLYRLITLPELPEAVRAEAVRHEARRVIPVSLDQVYLSYQPLPAAKGETRLFLTAFPKKAADALVSTLNRVGIEPYLMDLAPLALCRNADEPKAIIINAWLSHLDIVVMADRVPQVIRSLSLPSEATSLSEILPAITEELNRTVTFYNSSHLEQPLDSSVPILVSGDLAETPESWQSLAGGLNSSVAILPSPIELPDGFNPNQFMINIGLALKELALEKGNTNFSLVNFNALPEVYLPKAPAIERILLPMAIAIVGLGLLSFMVFLVQSNMAQTSALQSQLASTESLITQHREEIETLKEQIGQVEAQIEPKEAIVGTLNATLTDLERGRLPVDGDLGQIVDLLPVRAELTGVNYGSDSVVITGTSPTESLIFDYARLLRSQSRYSSVTVSSIEEGTNIEEDAKQFDFRLLLK